MKNYTLNLKFIAMFITKKKHTDSALILKIFPLYLIQFLTFRKHFSFLKNEAA